MSDTGNRYSERSRRVLNTCHPDLHRLARTVLPYWDHSALRGIRTIEDQTEYVEMGWSKTMNSRHLPGGGILGEPGSWRVVDPKGSSYAMDLQPYPKPKPKRMETYYAFAGYVLATADQLDIAIDWGGDWDGDKDLFDQRFFDLVHFQLRRKR